MVERGLAACKTLGIPSKQPKFSGDAFSCIRQRVVKTTSANFKPRACARPLEGRSFRTAPLSAIGIRVST